MTNVCPYCGKTIQLVDSSKVYGKSYGKIYLCSGYPKCDARVGVHKATGQPLGAMADQKTRRWRKIAHTLFDQKWEGKAKGRNKRRHRAYRWLQEAMGLSADKAHIAMFNEKQCKYLVEILEIERKWNS